MPAIENNSFVRYITTKRENYEAANSDVAAHLISQACVALTKDK